MTGSSLLLRLGAGWAAAVVLLLVAAPAAPATEWSPPGALAAGVLVGVGLFLVLGGLAPRALAVPRPSTALVLLVAAGAEEVVWRWFALGELAQRADAGAALAVTTVAFALAHRNDCGRQLVTGAVLGGLYVGTGSLAAAWCAHGLYNLGVAAAHAGAAR